MSYSPQIKNSISTFNSTTTPLVSSGSFTGEWEDVLDYNSLVIAVNTDQNGNFVVQFSSDGVNVDSSLIRYYKTSNIEPPHRFTITRQYMRIIFTNDSGVDQTYLRMQVLLGDKTELNIPLDSLMAQDFDAIATRPSNYKNEVALNRRQGEILWNKFGYNNDLNIGTEIIASWGGSFTPLTTATTLTLSSSSPNDTNGGSGCNSLVIYGIDGNRDPSIEVVTLSGNTKVITTSEWLGINREAMFLCGSGKTNEGIIDTFATTGGSQMAQMPANGGVTQQCLFHVPRNHQFVLEWLRINILNRAKDATTTFKMWVYSAVSNGKQEVYKVDIDTKLTNDVSETPPLPFPISEQTVIWMEGTSDKDNIIVNGRFSGILVKDIDA